MAARDYSDSIRGAGPRGGGYNDIARNDRLQPTLLDRLSDDQPTRSQDTLADRVITRRQLRQIILRDLSWLLNAINMESEIDFGLFEHARNSTINYGLPAFSGRMVSSLKMDSLKNELRDAIVKFEPRIVGKTLQVGVFLSDHDFDAAHNLIMLEIRGQIWANPAPIEMLVKSSIDLETGTVTLQDQLGDS